MDVEARKMTTVPFTSGGEAYETAPLVFCSLTEGARLWRRGVVKGFVPGFE